MTTKKAGAGRRALVGLLMGTAVATGAGLTAAAPATAAGQDLPPAVSTGDASDQASGQARIQGPDYWVRANGARLRAAPVTGRVLNLLQYGNGLDPICWWNWDGDPWLRAHAWGGATGYIHWSLVHVGAARPGRC